MTRDEVAARFRDAGVTPDPDELDRFAERAPSLRALVESFRALAHDEEEDDDDAR